MAAGSTSVFVCGGSPHVAVAAGRTVVAPTLSACGPELKQLQRPQVAASWQSRDPLLAGAVVGLAASSRHSRSSSDRTRARSQAEAVITKDGPATDVVEKEGDMEEEEEKRGRQVQASFEADLDFTLDDASRASMDDFMRQNAIEVCLQNVERIEPGGEEENIKFIYLKPQDFGPSRSQMRMKVQVEVVRSGCVNVHILDMEPGGVDKKTGEVTFDPANKPDFSAKNEITWQEKDNGQLLVVNSSRSTSIMPIPWWFPVPDPVVERISNFFVKQVVTAGMKAVNEQIAKRYTEWSAKTS